RLLVSLVGVPGAGKTTLARRLLAALCARAPDSAVVVPMDGFHLPRSALDAMPDPAAAHRRRGAPFTFDPAALLGVVRAIRSQQPGGPSVWAPSFDHSVGDPIPHDIQVKPSHEVLIFEGLYLHLRDDPWCLIRPLMDLTVSLDIPLDVATDRLAARHLATGLVESLEEGRRRAIDNDRVNAVYIMETSVP
ncbi:P-loop containing nucleoside triphosphate hydrolase protein, partial [Entophlyctis helioformis]